MSSGRQSLRASKRGEKSGLVRLKMEGVSKVLDLPVIIERRGLLPLKAQLPQKFDLFLGCITAEGSILQECSEPRLFLVRGLRLPLRIQISSGVPGPLGGSG